MCLFFGFLTVIALFLFGPFNQGFLAPVATASELTSLLWLLGIIPLAAIVVAIIFNFKVIRMVYGKTGPSARFWKINSVIVTIAVGLLLLSTFAGLFLIVSADYSVSGAISSVGGGLVQTAVMLAIMLFPYWLRKKLGFSAGAASSMQQTPVAPPPAGLAAAPTELPGSNLPSVSGPATAATPDPAAPSDTPKPQS
jgi:hypothetical protein